MTPEIDIQKIILAAEKGGWVIAGYFGELLEVEEKSTVADWRTKADTEAEAAILSELKSQFPDFAIYSEESGEIHNDSPYRFVIDPLDGSNNFCIGIPQFSVSIGLMKNNEIIAGIIHHPILKKTYYAQKGQGAYCSGRKLQVSQVQDIKRATVSFVNSYRTDPDLIMTAYQRLSDISVMRMLRNWSVALDFCLLADGKIESVINNNTEIYDFAAGRLIALEAGAVMTDFRGQPTKADTDPIFIMSNNQAIHDQLLPTVGDIAKKS